MAEYDEDGLLIVDRGDVLQARRGAERLLKADGVRACLGDGEPWLRRAEWTDLGLSELPAEGASVAWPCRVYEARDGERSARFAAYYDLDGDLQAAPVSSRPRRPGRRGSAPSAASGPRG